MTARDVRKPGPGRIIVAPEYPGCVGTGDAPAIGQSAKHPGRFSVGTESALTLRPFFADDPRPEWFDNWPAARRRYLELVRPWLRKVLAARAQVQAARAALRSDPTDLSAALTLSDSGQLP
jgi:hypothetical protein